MLLPALAAAKQRAQAAQCMSNTHQILLAWIMEAGDHNDVLAPNDYPFTTCYWTAANKSWMKNWVVGTMENQIDANYGFGVKELQDPNRCSPLIFPTRIFTIVPPIIMSIPARTPFTRAVIR